MGIEYEVVWNGTLDRNEACFSLIAPRETKPGETWVAPNRLYNKTGIYSKKAKGETDGTKLPGIDGHDDASVGSVEAGSGRVERGNSADQGTSERSSRETE